MIFLRHSLLYFTDKVELIRSSWAGAAPPVISQQCQQLSLTAYSPVDVSDVLRTLSQSPNKHTVCWTRFQRGAVA